LGILTIRDDEFHAVREAFPQEAGAGVYQGANRQYMLRHAEVSTGERYTVAILREAEQGAGGGAASRSGPHRGARSEAGAGGGHRQRTTSDDVTLGDVVLGTSLHDYTVEAVKTGFKRRTPG